MKLKLVGALAAVLSVTLLVGGATMALFSAQTANTNSTFTAGTLCLRSDRDDGDPIPGPMFYVTPAQGQTPGGVPGTLPTGYWVPGDSNIRTLIVSNPDNCSDMDGWLDTVQASLHPGSDAILATKMWVEITTSRPGFLGDFVIAEGWMSDFLAGAVPLLYPDGSRVPMNLNSLRFLHFTVTLDSSADNSFQSKTLVVDFTLNGSQMSHNP